MGEFQLIVLSEVNRPARKARESGAFSLVPFPERGRAGMASSALPEDGEGEIKPADIENWYTPIEACAYARRCVGAKGASNAVWRLLEAGLIEAVANSASRTPKDSAPIARTTPVRIPERHWKSYTDHGSDLWSGGYARFWVVRKGYDSGTTYQYFGIRLNPHDVRSNLPAPRPPDAIAVKATPAVTVSHPSDTPIAPAALAATSPADQATSDVPDNDVANKGPPVAPDHLKAWFDLYRRVYSGSSDTEANALVSARGMFPGKSVSRDSVRALRGTQKRGRKATDTAN
jgi:hypothetical protein